MNYHDRIYGAAEITAPVLLDLMNSRAALRLRGVLQHGVTALLHITSPTTRFEHSVGVMLLTQRLGAPLKEQIAALLHDVSHTAFSHVIDFVFGGHARQSYHEEKKAEHLATTDLPSILAQHGYDWRDFVDEEAYPLLEQPAPALCADRLDYFLRDSRDLGLATAREVSNVLAHLVAHQGQIAVDDLATARWMADTYLAADRASWANFREVGLYELTARALRTALAHGVIHETDLWSTDEVLWQKLRAHGDSTLQQQMRLISPQTRFVRDEVTPDFRVRAKQRTIDPHVLHEGKLFQLSELDEEFARRRKQYLEAQSGAWPMRIIS